MTTPVWKRVSSGRYLDLAAFTVADVTLDDITTSLSQLKRFDGHYQNAPPLTVLQHSILVAYILVDNGASPMTSLAGLVHDAHEAYLGDISAPTKRYLGVQDTGDICDAVRAFFELDDTVDWETVHRADLQALDIERRRQWPSVSGDHVYWPNFTPFFNVNFPIDRIAAADGSAFELLLKAIRKAIAHDRT